MAVIETKYSVGDVVYSASTVTERKQHPCPDCQGVRKWKAVSPSGTEYSFACPRCAASYMSNADMSLTYSAYVPTAARLTIGSVQFNSHPGSYDHGARYMCVETGIGGGSVYNEDRLFLTEDEARVAAQALADEQNTTTEWIVKLYNKALEISDYQLEHASMKLAADATSRAGSMLWNLSDLFDAINEAEGKDDILEAVERYKNYDWARDKAKVETALREAAELAQGVQP